MEAQADPGLLSLWRRELRPLRRQDQPGQDGRFGALRLGFHRLWNVFVYTTHARNRFLEIDYRTTNSVGLCLHSFGPDVFDVLLVSVGATPELERPSDGDDERSVRATARLNFVVGLSERAKLGVDVWYAPSVTKLSDYRVYAEAYLDVDTWGPLGLRLSVTDEYDSAPRPGVRKNDLAVVPYLLVRFGE